MSTLDTHIAPIELPLAEAIKPRVEAVLDAGYETHGGFWLEQIEAGLQPGFPRVVFRADTRTSRRFQRLEKFGLEVDAELLVSSPDVSVVYALMEDLQEDLTSIDDPPTPDGFQHHYTRLLDPITLEQKRAGESDKLTRALRLQYHFTTL